jgi:hypothetical protein
VPGITGIKLRRWSAEELRLLREYYRAIGCEATAALLGRTRSAVWSRAYLLGLTEPNPVRAQRFHPARMST